MTENGNAPPRKLLTLSDTKPVSRYVQIIRDQGSVHEEYIGDVKFTMMSYSEWNDMGDLFPDPIRDEHKKWDVVKGRKEEVLDEQSYAKAFNEAAMLRICARVAYAMRESEVTQEWRDEGKSVKEQAEAMRHWDAGLVEALKMAITRMMGNVSAKVVEQAENFHGVSNAENESNGALPHQTVGVGDSTPPVSGSDARL